MLGRIAQAAGEVTDGAGVFGVPTSDEMKQGTVSRIRDFGVYVAIAIAVYVAIVLFAFNTTQPISDFEFNWIGLAGVTVVVFGETIRTSRRLWREARFWYVIATALIAQLGLGTAGLWRAPRLSTVIWGCVIFPASFAALQVCIGHFTRARPVVSAVQRGPTMR